MRLLLLAHEIGEGLGREPGELPDQRALSGLDCALASILLASDPGCARASQAVFTGLGHPSTAVLVFVVRDVILGEGARPRLVHPTAGY